MTLLPFEVLLSQVDRRIHSLDEQFWVFRAFKMLDRFFRRWSNPIDSAEISRDLFIRFKAFWMLRDGMKWNRLYLEADQSLSNILGNLWKIFENFIVKASMGMCNGNQLIPNKTIYSKFVWYFLHHPERSRIQKACIIHECCCS